MSKRYSFRTNKAVKMKLLPCFLLYVLLAAGTSLAVDVNWLTKVVKVIITRYQIQDKHYSLAVTIPQQQDPNKLYEVLKDDKPENVKKSVDEGKVYEGTRMIFSVPIKPDHAERLVLQKLSSLRKYTKNNFLLIYSYLSPCRTCTDRKSEYNILKLIERDVHYWPDGAFVFTRVFDQPKSENEPKDREEIIHSLYEVGCSMGGLKYIFRCDGPSNSPLECHSCDERFRASEFCITNSPQPPQAGSSGTNTQGNRG
ncbi:hypothetical protein ACER0C_028252 [Sarotherodon galilaeus]